MSRSPQFVDDDTPTLKFEIPGRGRRTAPPSGADDPAYGDVVTADEAAELLGVSRWSLFLAEQPHGEIRLSSQEIEGGAADHDLHLEFWCSWRSETRPAIRNVASPTDETGSRPL